MPAFSLSVGLTVYRGDRELRLRRHLKDGELIFEDVVYGQPYTTTLAKFWADVQSGALHLVRGEPAASDQRPMLVVFDWTSLPEAVRSEVERRLRYITALRRAGLTRGMRREIERQLPCIAESLKEVQCPSASTVMSWLRAWEAEGQSIAALVPRTHQRKSPRRLPETVLALARRGLRDIYCQRDKPSLANTLTQIKGLLATEATAGRIESKHSGISISTLRRLSNEIDPYQRDMARLGAVAARNNWRYALKGAREQRAMARYEIDHTLLDVVVVCDRTGMPLGRPTITVVVDTYSSYVAGMFISFWGTGIAATFAALKNAFAPKGDLVEALGLDQAWLAFGLCECLAMDNGLEFHSQAMRLVALSMAIDLIYCAVRQPWLKPVIERTLGTLVGYLPSAGRVRKASSNELLPRPEDSAAVTFSDLCRGITKAIVEIHAFEPNQRKLSRPYDLFADSLASLPPPLVPTSMQELELAVAASKRVTVNHEGVVFQYLRFNSRELQEIRRQTARSFQTTVKFDAENLGYIWVQDPKSGHWLHVPSCDGEYSTGLSLVQHKAIRTHAKRELTRRHPIEQLQRAKLELIEMWAARTHKGKRLKGAHLKALSGLTSSHVYAQPTTPGAVGPFEMPQPDRLLAPDDLVAQIHEVPAFEFFDFGGAVR